MESLDEQGYQRVNELSWSTEVDFVERNSESSGSGLHCKGEKDNFLGVRSLCNCGPTLVFFRLQYLSLSAKIGIRQFNRGTCAMVIQEDLVHTTGIGTQDFAENALGHVGMVGGSGDF